MMVYLSLHELMMNTGSHGKINHKESPKTKAEKEKDRHVSKTGRNEVVKKGGSGCGNWGGPEEEIKEALESRS